jgi:hypothetical protein
MNVINKYNIILFSQIYIVLIYCLNLIFSSSLFSGFFFLLYIFLILYLLLNNFFLELTLTKIIIIIFLIIGISSPTTAWDARSVWMFHGKRIFFENNVLAQLDDYGKLNNDYPIFVSYYSAQIANLLNLWNEIVPKLSPFLISIPGIIFLSSLAKNKKQELLICFLYLFILDKKMIMGECDAILSIYLTLIFVLLFKTNLKLDCNLDNNLYKTLFLVTSLIIFSNLKTISPLIIGIILSAYIFFNYNKLNLKFFLFFVLSLLPFFYFKIILSQHDIEKHLLEFLLSHNNIKLFFTDFRSHIKILNEILFNKEMLIAIILITIYISKEIILKKNDIIVLSTGFMSSFYIFVTFVALIYLITAIFIGHEFYDQLLWQIPRYISPACFLISFEVIHQLFVNTRK